MIATGRVWEWRSGGKTYLCPNNVSQPELGDVEKTVCCVSCVSRLHISCVSCSPMCQGPRYPHRCQGNENRPTLWEEGGGWLGGSHHWGGKANILSDLDCIPHAMAS